MIADVAGVAMDLWLEPMTFEALQIVRKHHRQMRGEFPDGFVSLVVQAENTLRLESPAAVRDEAVALVREASAYVRASAVVLEGGGFAVAGMRAAASGIALLARPKYPVKIVGSVVDGAAFLAGHAPRSASREAIGADAIARIVGHLRGESLS